MTHAPIANVAITLNAVLAAVADKRPMALCVRAGDAVGLPYGPFDPERHRTFEIGVREWVTRQTQMQLGYIEQLYTFGDKGREASGALKSDAASSNRVVSVGYLALAAETAPVRAVGADWRDWYHFFPWEDWRNGEPSSLGEHILPALEAWARDGARRDEKRARIAAAFGLGGADWDDARALDRFELMYEAGIVAEAARDRGVALSEGFATGRPMLADHRRILATAIGRLRGKLRYRPILFELAPPTFTLLALQQIAEAVVGFTFHKQNFRRGIERSGMVERTGAATQQAGGRPAALFRVNPRGMRAHAMDGLAIPRMRRDAAR